MSKTRSLCRNLELCGLQSASLFPMAVTSYRPIPQVVTGIGEFAKNAGFKKVGNRFRRTINGQHGLVLYGEDAFANRPDHYREGHWTLSVCFGPWADVVQRSMGKPVVDDPMKFNPMRHHIVEFRPKIRPNLNEDPRRELLGYYDNDPADVADFVQHHRQWFEQVAFPLAQDWLAHPEKMLEKMQIRLASYHLHPATDIHFDSASNGQIALLAAITGDLELARSNLPGLPEPSRHILTDLVERA